jgi:hypothetical protein
MKSLSVYSFIMIILSFNENFNERIKLNFLVSAMGLNTKMNSLPQNQIAVSTSQNFMNLNTENGKTKMYDGLNDKVKKIIYNKNEKDKEIQNHMIDSISTTNEKFLKKVSYHNSNSDSDLNNKHIRNNDKSPEKSSETQTPRNFPQNSENDLSYPTNISEISHISNLAYKIKSIDTIILLKKNQTDANIKEKIQFELSTGTFTQIITKISLQSSADKFSNFRLSS